MMDKQAAELCTEIKKIRNDMDAIKAYCMTMAESSQTIAAQVTIIATNTTPADSDDTEPEAEPAGT